MTDKIFRGAPFTRDKTSRPNLKSDDRPSAQIVRLSWPRTRHKFDLKSVRIAVLTAPRLPTLGDRMERFLEMLSRGTADEASKALNKLAMMVTAEAIGRGVPAAEILTPIGAKIIGRWNNDQVHRQRMNLLEHWDSFTGSKTRQGIVEMVLDLLNDDERMEAELDAQFESLKQNLNNEDLDLASIQGLVYGQSAAFANALERYGEDRIAPAMIRCFKRILPELDMRIAGAILSKVGAAGRSIARELPRFSEFDGTGWVAKRTRILVMFHDAFHRARGEEPPPLKATPGHGALCYEFLEDYSKSSAARIKLDGAEIKGKERDG
jgi:hypothetical protein